MNTTYSDKITDFLLCEFFLLSSQETDHNNINDKHEEL